MMKWFKPLLKVNILVVKLLVTNIKTCTIKSKFWKTRVASLQRPPFNENIFGPQPSIKQNSVLNARPGISRAGFIPEKKKSASSASSHKTTPCNRAIHNLAPQSRLWVLEYFSHYRSILYAIYPTFSTSVSS